MGHSTGIYGRAVWLAVGFRFALGGALARAESPEPPPAIVRIAAARALGHLGPAAAVDPLIALHEDRQLAPMRWSPSGESAPPRPLPSSSCAK